jgi:hypothetical protein
VNLAVLVPEGPAVQEQTKLGDKRDANGDHGWHVQLAFMIARRCKLANRFDDQYQGDGCHDETKGNVSSGFQATFAGWEPMGVDAIDGAIAKDQCQVAIGQISACLLLS